MNSKLLINLFICFVLSSCAGLVDSAKKMMGDKQPKTKPVYVSKAKYDDLLVKYKNLNDKYMAIQAKDIEANKFNQIDELSSKVSKGSSETTVDVFETQNQKRKIVTAPLPTDKVTQQLSLYKKGLTLKDNGKLKDALSIFQSLEKKSSDQIRVRAKYQTALIYYNQNQFDLSLQVFESILDENSYSSKVIDALRGAIRSARSLGLKQKVARYESVLQDFFGLKG
ncbi:MAG: tetratricopeptide repeat protein [Bacteriovoracaceae bacterium]|jgi:tetratricopeptide (TPR) repeat protein|nr:tetratricopeptide repeat protein [Bacteriovoracaceae bacterium]